MKPTIDVTAVPASKKISKYPIIVDYFHSNVCGSSLFFLSHFHSDHYAGLTKSFPHPVYCSETTASLVHLKIKCQAVPLAMNQIHKLTVGQFDLQVQLIDANHCPGAVVLLFQLNNEYYYHTGDFRYNKHIHHSDIHFNSIYLDNTFESFKNFESQSKSINQIINRISSVKLLVPVKIIIYCAAYLIGKEKIYLSLAEWMNSSVQVSNAKLEILKCLSKSSIEILDRNVMEIVGNKQAENQSWFKPTERISKIENETRNGILSRVTLEEAPIRVISVRDIARIREIAKETNVDKVYVLYGSGWQEKVEYKNYQRADGKIIKKGIEIVYFRYSEHSSDEELKEFINTMKYDKIIRTVGDKSSKLII